ncbi:hypothetical protein VNO80_06906 [Phaseolus coccineus]|uniref:Uncharacterized protein n=1 Tax=Phaseolus coccineus TaxID=3886 RepID=A0AAN9NIT1_PHACN
MGKEDQRWYEPNTNLTARGRVDGGSIKLVALKDGVSGDKLVARGTKGGGRRVGRGNQSWGDRGDILRGGRLVGIDEWDEKGREVFLLVDLVVG